MTRLAPTLGCLLILGVTAGCARSRATLMPGEAGAPVGAVAVLDESGADRAVVSNANDRASFGGKRVRTKALDPRTVEKRYGGLLADLPPPPSRYTLYFLEDSTVLTEASEQELARLLAEVPSRPGAEVQVIGHTDTLGSDEENDTLSADRAQHIRGLLIERNLPPSVIRVSGRGEREPLEMTGDGVRSARNRRVEVLVR